MCGVGKYMVRWKQRESPGCPRCGDFEDAEHVWKCRGSNSDHIWKNSIENLRLWMSQNDTDPDIAELLVDMLNSWREDTNTNNTPAYGLSLLQSRQQEIGYSAIIEGRLSYEWEACQQAYLTFIRSRRTGRRWVTLIIQRLWDIAWDLWEHRNGILHLTNNNHASVLEDRYLDQRITSAYNKLLRLALSTDGHLTKCSLLDITGKHQQYKRSWLLQAEGVIRAVQTKVRLDHERRIRELNAMRSRLRSWLSGNIS